MHTKKKFGSHNNHLCVENFQVIKCITDGRADFSFECVGDTDMITTALQSCCDVILYKPIIFCVDI